MAKHPGLVVTFGKDVGREKIEELADEIFRLVIKLAPNCGAGVWLQDAPWVENLVGQQE